MGWLQTATVICAIAALTGLQTIWIVRALDRISARLDRLAARLGDVDERLARLEAALGS